MFLTLDLNTPALKTHLRHLKIKNTVLHHWPTSTKNGLKVLDDLELYKKGTHDTLPNGNDGKGVRYDESRKKLYKMLGIDWEADLVDQDWKGVDRAWLYYDGYHPDLSQYNITTEQIWDYIQKHTKPSEVLSETEEKEYIDNQFKKGTPEYKNQQNEYDPNTVLKKITKSTTYVNKLHYEEYKKAPKLQYSSLPYYSPLLQPKYKFRTAEEVIVWVSSDEDVEKYLPSSPRNFKHGVVTYGKGSDDSFKYTTESSETDSEDSSGNDYVNRTFYGNEQGTAIKTNPCTFLALMDINEVVFKRSFDVIKKETGTRKEDGVEYGYSRVIIKFSFKLKSEVSYEEALPFLESVRLKILKFKRSPFMFYKQARDMVETYEPQIASQYTTINNGKSYLIYDEIKTLKSEEFVKLVTDSLDQDYREESCHGWKCYIAPIIAILIIVVSIVTLQPELTAVGLATLEGAMLAAAYFGLLALNLMVGALILAGVAKYEANRDEYGLAISFGNMVVIIGKMSELAGMMSMMLNIASIAEKWALAAAQEAALKGLEEAGIKEFADVALKEVSSVVTSTFINIGKGSLAAIRRLIGWLNTGFALYTATIGKVEQPPGGAPAESQQDTTHIEQQLVWQRSFDDYLFLDMNTQMEQMPAEMTTRGLMRRTLCKYYDAL